MRRVLILEQEAFLGTLLSERFRRSGYEVELLPIPNALGASYAPDLIIVGNHTATLPCLYSWVATTPTIVLGDQQALSTRLFPKLGKPFSPDRLVRLANSYLLARRLSQSRVAGSGEVGIIPIS